MLRSFITICSILMSISTFGQDYFPIGATWHYGEHYAFDPGIGFLKLESIGDTIINDSTCRIIAKNSGDGCCNRPQIEYFHTTDSGEVLFYTHELGKFQKLLDFNAEIGDSWMIELMGTSMKPEIVDTIVVTVDSITITVVNDKDLNMFHTTMYSKQHIFPVDRNNPYIERIGPTGYFFPWNFGGCDVNFVHGLRCYEDSVVGQYSTGLTETCDYEYISNGFVEVTKTPEILLSPNPATNLIEVTIQDIDGFNYVLVDLQGKQLLKGRSNSSSHVIDLSSIRPGLFFLRAYTNDSSLPSKLIIKN